MTKLDTLLLELEQLDRERTPELWTMRLAGRNYRISVLNIDLGKTNPNTYSKEDAAFIVKAVNSNKVLREVIRIQREALGLCASSTQFAPGEYGYQFILLARQALEAAERVCEEKACEEKE